MVAEPVALGSTAIYPALWIQMFGLRDGGTVIHDMVWISVTEAILFLGLF